MVTTDVDAIAIPLLKALGIDAIKDGCIRKVTLVMEANCLPTLTIERFVPQKDADALTKELTEYILSRKQLPVAADVPQWARAHGVVCGNSNEVCNLYARY